MELGGLDRAEGAARSRQDDALHGLGALEVEDLEDGAVLGIDGQQGRPVPCHFAHDDVARAHERLLVRKPDDGAALDRGEGRLEPRRSHDRRHHALGRPARGIDHRLAAGPDLDPAPGKGRLELAVVPLVRDHGEGRTVAQGLCGQALDVAIGGEGGELELCWIAREQVERAAADRAGRAQDRDALGGRRPREAAIGLWGTQRHASAPPAEKSSMRAKAGAAASRPSTRSKSPPWPGMRPLMSLI